MEAHLDFVRNLEAFLVEMIRLIFKIKLISIIFVYFNKKQNFLYLKRLAIYLYLLFIIALKKSIPLLSLKTPWRKLLLSLRKTLSSRWILLIRKIRRSLRKILLT